MGQSRVLILTGGLLDANENSLIQAIKKIALQSRGAESAWLEHRVKLTGAEPLIHGRLEALSSFVRGRRDWKTARRYLKSDAQVFPPELAEVVLATALENEGLPYSCLSFSEFLADPANSEKILETTSCIFVSTTFLRDLSEMEPLIQLIKRPHLRIVVGGALAALLKQDWNGSSDVDVLAVGYGESLVPALAKWVRSGFQTLEAPSDGYLQKLPHTRILVAGSPPGTDLDHLPTPDWRLPSRYRGQKFNFIHYESVRGCPYRCAFCNYPYLFNDKKFRYKSARKIADDWTWYVQEMGVNTIQCLDSLFTMPKRRIVELCDLLIERKLNLKWLCYARADDLIDESLVQLMKRAGCFQVQIGLESGDQGQLDRMAKTTKVEENLRAIQNCRKHGITSTISLIVGFPGETKETLENTFRFMSEARPDFHFLATFSTRVPGVPILTPESRHLHGLWTMENPRTVSPYWVHNTMSCGDVSGHVRRLNRRLIGGRVSLDASLYYRGLLKFEPRDREYLLDFQKRAMDNHPVLTSLFTAADIWMEKRLKADIETQHPMLPPAPRPPRLDELVGAQA